MSTPMLPQSTKIKRSAGEQSEEPPSKKRTIIPDDLTPDRGEDRDRSRSKRKLVPMISRAETSQFQDYLADASSAGETSKEEDDSEGEFVDAQEAVSPWKWGEAAAPEDNVPEEQSDVRSDASETEAGINPTGRRARGRNIKDSDSEMSEEGEVDGQDKPTKQEDMEDESQSSAPPKSKRKQQKAQKIKPETISIASDSDEEGDDDVPNNTGDETSDAENEDENISGTDQDRKEQNAVISIEDDEEEDEDTDAFDDMFTATFGKGKAKQPKIKEPIEEDIDSSNNSSFSGGPRSKSFTSGPHATTIHDNNPVSNNDSRHTTTPSSTPPPAAAISSLRPQPPPRRRPDLKRDLSTNLIRHEKFHTKAQLLIPRLPNHENFDWTRRYWIAVAIQGKRFTKSNITEKDFVWMRGNRFSTVATVFHSYALTVMADPEDLALVLGYEGVEMTDQMQELDYFNDRLVVFRAVKVKGNEREAEGRSLVPGVIPESAVISLDLD